MKKAVLLILAVMTISACGGGGGGADPSKDLFSLWKRDSDNAPFDLTGGAFGGWGVLYFLLGDNTNCYCKALAVGDQSSGAVSLQECGSSSSCRVLNGAYTYTKSSKNLTICHKGTCYGYH
jgi:hypothetical protein